MRLHLLAIVLLAGAAMPASAQAPSVERRVGKLESEMRAVQRKVFPGGNIEPEIRAELPLDAPVGVPAGTAIADLTARVDALEAQLARLTGQAEENAYRLRQLEQEFARLRTETENRLTLAERAAAAPEPEPEPAAPTQETDAPAVDGGVSAPDTGDAAEDGYLTGYRLWEAGRHADAARILEATAKKHPKHRRASYAANLAGRAYLDDGKPATAAKILLANYQDNPTGERAADSLYFLGASLLQLKKAPEACKVYDELADVYAANMRDWVRQRLPKARADAKCGA